MSKDSTFRSRQQAGNGTHLNISLWDAKGQRNILHNADDPNKISDVCKHFMGESLYGFHFVLFTFFYVF